MAAPSVADILAAPSWESKANFFSRWTLSYLAPLLRLGAKQPLTSIDIGGLMDDDKAESVYRKIKADWDHQAANPVYEPAKEGGLRVEKPRSMARALLRSYGTGKFIFGEWFIAASSWGGGGGGVLRGGLAFCLAFSILT